MKGLEQIAFEVKDIAGRARENKLKPEELSGGTFTVSNLGMYGVNISLNINSKAGLQANLEAFVSSYSIIYW